MRPGDPLPLVSLAPQRLGALLLATALTLSAGAAIAQQGDDPVITLPGADADTAEPSAAPDPATAPEAVAPANDGMIRQPPPVAEESPASPEAGAAVEANGEASAPDPATETAAIPVERDRGESEAAASAGWLIRPMPAEMLPEGVVAGAGLSGPGILRLTGETASVDLVIDLPPVSPLPDALKFTLQTSVNVLPEQASLQVTVNNAEPAKLPLDHLGSFSSVSLPTSALVAGTNRIGLTLTQPHRIFCGPEATFGVWTEIDLSQSGVQVAESGLGADARDFAMAARSETAGGRSLVLLTDDNTDPALIRSVTQQLTRALGPGGRVTLRSFYSLGPQPIASVALIESDAPRAEVRMGASRGLVLQIEHNNGTLPDLEPFLSAFPPAQVSGAPALEPGVRTALSTLGSEDIIGNTHYFRRDVPFSLPPDWLLMANQKARLDLHYGFARSLPKGAILLVKINDQTIRLLPLDEKGGEVLPLLQIGFNANILHPGRNALSFEMMVPGSPPDGACPIRRSDMLVVLSDSTLTIPPSPPMVLPGLATALLRIDPAAVIAPPEAVDHTKLEREAMQIAAELAPPIDPLDTVRLQVVGLSDFALVPFDETGLTLSIVQKVLFPMVKPPVAVEAEPATPAAPARSTFTLSEDEAPAAAAPIDEPGFAGGLVRDLWQSLSPGAWIAGEYQALRDSAFVGTAQSLPDWLEGRSGTALLLRPEFNQRGELWLMLGPGASPQDVGAALNRLRENSLAQGEAALLQEDGSWQVWTPIRPPRLLDMPAATEVRTILGNYASWSPLIFTLAMLGLALLSALPALFYVLLSRRKGMEQ